MKSRSIKMKFLVLIIIVLTPLLFLEGVRIHLQNRSLIETELQASLELAEAISKTFVNYLEEVWQGELAIGSIFALNPDMLVEKMEKYMNYLLEADDQTVAGYSWVSPEGIVVAGTHELQNGTSVVDKQYFQEILQGKDEVITTLTYCESQQIYVVPVARAIRMQGELVGVVVAFSNLEKLGSKLPKRRTGVNSIFGIVDSGGRIVYRLGSPDITQRNVVVPPDSPSWKALNTGEIVKTYRRKAHVDGVERMGIDYPIREIGWECFVTASVRDVLAFYRKGLIRDIIVLFLVGIVSVLAALVLARDVLRPIGDLQKAALAITGGDLAVRTGITGYDELAATGKAFDQMAERIELLEKNRSLFLQTSAHELRNPMTNIKGVAMLLLRRIDAGKPTESLREMLITLNKEVDRLAVILNQILDAFKMQRGQTLMTFQFEPVNVVELIQSTLVAFQMAEEERNISLETELNAVWVKADAMRIEDVLRNILGNARKYSPDKSPIHVTVRENGTDVVIGVVDRGIGIPEEQLTQIFEGFERGKNLKGNDPGGMGLGLYICRDIILRHGGEIWAQNNSEGGSTFYIRLPIDQTSAAASIGD